MRDYLDFEKPIRELEEKIEKLASAESPKSGTQDEIRKLRTKLAQVEHQLYTTLTPWQRTQLARHPQRPTTLDYINELSREFLELHGDRSFGDDRAIVGGFARFNDRSVMIIGHQKERRSKSVCSGTSACPIRKATGRRCGSCGWRKSSAARSLR